MNSYGVAAHDPKTLSTWGAARLMTGWSGACMRRTPTRD
jgi:hypothetical protein